MMWQPKKQNRQQCILTPVHFLCPFEELWYVVFQDSEGRVDVLQHPHHSIVPLHILLGLLQSVLGVEAPASHTSG